MINDINYNNKNKIEIKIDNLILDGFDHTRGMYVAEQIQAELAKLCQQWLSNHNMDAGLLNSAKTIDTVSHSIKSKNPDEISISSADAIFQVISGNIKKQNF